MSPLLGRKGWSRKLEKRATSGFEPALTAHEAIVTTITPYRLEHYILLIRTKRLELLRDYSHFFLREDCLPNFNMFVVISHSPL